MKNVRRATVGVVLLAVLACSAYAAAYVFAEVDLGARFEDNGLSTFTLPSKTPSFQISPYIQNVTADCATILWQTDIPSFGKVTISDESGNASHKTVRARRLSEVRISGLSPDTCYTYSVEILGNNGDTGGSASGADYAFKTFPTKDRPITFAVYGDSRSLPDRHSSVIDAMANEENLAFVLHSGDMVGNGTVLGHWIPEYFEPTGQLTRRVPFFTVLGNHERNSPYYFAYYDLPQNERFYSFDVLDIHVIGLDSNVNFDEGSPQYSWLISDLEQHKNAKWKFVFMHHPTYTSGPHGKVDAAGVPVEGGIRLAQKLLPGLAAKYGIQAVFSGHDHAYERSTRDGVHYIVTGGGGAPTYSDPNAKNNPYRKVFHARLHYCVVTIDGDKGTMVVKTPKGKVLDKISF